MTATMLKSALESGLETEAFDLPTEAPAAYTSESFVHLNGQLVPKSDARVSIYDHGFLYGDGAFEGIRVYQTQYLSAGTASGAIVPVVQGAAY